MKAVSNLFSNITISQEECDYIEVNTRGQAGNSLYNLQRQGRITSSNIGYEHSTTRWLIKLSDFSNVLFLTIYESGAVQMNQQQEDARNIHC